MVPVTTPTAKKLKYMMAAGWLVRTAFQERGKRAVDVAAIVHAFVGTGRSSTMIIKIVLSRSLKDS